jgi:alkylation response protein AidB-like acyl-CoA dehydrogenase
MSLIDTSSRSAHVSQTVLDKLSSQFAASAADYDARGVFPLENFQALHEAGLLGLTVPADLGGQGAGLGETLRVLRAVARGEPSTALILFMTYGYWAGSFARLEKWPRPLYERLAREAATSVSLIGGLRVEPELGTPLRGGLPATIARRVSDGWSITGSKIYSTGSTGLSWYSVWARTDEQQPRVGSFLVRAGAPGVHIEPVWDHLGMRASVSHQIFFDDTPTPLDHAVDIRTPEEWANESVGGERAPLWFNLSVATIYDAVARAARDWLVGYLKERVPTNLGASLSTLPRVQEKFGEIEALLFANDILIGDAARRSDAGDIPSAGESNLIKYIATANAIKAVEIGLELTGNPGLSKKNPLERHYRDVLCGRVHSPQSDTVLIAAARRAFGA